MGKGSGGGFGSGARLGRLLSFSVSVSACCVCGVDWMFSRETRFGG